MDVSLKASEKLEMEDNRYPCGAALANSLFPRNFGLAPRDSNAVAECSPVTRMTFQ